ncbi:MAG: hypothetical protein IJM59_02845 [Proteobacteria bacterium]|nr:hypothetical protein [Pseudomonadota bacterium]
MTLCVHKPAYTGILALALALGFFLLPEKATASPGEVVSLDTEDASLDAMQSADEKAIAVIEKRPFSKAGRGELSLGLGTIASDIFLVYLPVTLRGAYHFKEWVSLELSASYMGCFGSDVGKNQTRAADQKCMRFLTPTYDRVTGSAASQTQLRNIILKEYEVARFTLDPVFSIFMGKFALANDAIAHFDLNLAAGIGVQIVEMPDNTNMSKINYGAAFEGNFGLGVRFVFLDFVGVRLDFREYLFGKQRDKGLGTSSEFSLSVSFLL